MGFLSDINKLAPINGQERDKEVQLKFYSHLNVIGLDRLLVHLLSLTNRRDVFLSDSLTNCERFYS